MNGLVRRPWNRRNKVAPLPTRASRGEGEELDTAMMEKAETLKGGKAESGKINGLVRRPWDRRNKVTPLPGPLPTRASRGEGEEPETAMMGNAEMLKC